MQRIKTPAIETTEGNGVPFDGKFYHIPSDVELEANPDLKNSPTQAIVERSSTGHVDIIQILNDANSRSQDVMNQLQ
ncbi:hypothetical protein KJ632_05570 [Patescibacteria group bacterium]|nr:hypothetical protein [Patescibacteria group bacterium]